MSTRNDKLLAAIAETAISNVPRAKFDLYRELLLSTLLVALDGEVNNDRETAPLLRLGNSQGQAAVLAFTDSNAVSRWRPDWPVIEIVPQTLFANLIPLPVQYLVINIGGPLDAVIEREVFGLLAQGVVPIATPSETVYLPAGTKSYYRAAEGLQAAAMREPIKVALRATSNVEAAYLVDRLVEGDKQPSLVLALHFRNNVSTAETREQMDRLGALGRAYLPVGESLLVMEADAHMVAQIRGTIEPVFRDKLDASI